MGIGISLPGISAKRLEALFADIAQPHRVHSKTNDFSLLDLEERGRRLNVKDDRDIGNEIAPHGEINRKRRFGSTRDADKDDVGTVEIFQPHAVIVLYNERQGIHPAIVIFVEPMDAARHTTRRRPQKGAQVR